MIDLIKDLPNWYDILWQGTYETILMALLSTIFSYALGLPIGVLLTITKKEGIFPKPKVNAVVGWLINMLRSIPFIILMIGLLPFTRLVLGTSIGTIASVIPLVVGATPFVARMIENALEELDTGLLEASQAMGASPWQIIYKVMLPEIKPNVLRGVSITIITLIGYSAMAGTIGGGGLGFIAISYGYARFQTNVMIYTIIILIILVQVIQSCFSFTAKRIDKRNR